LDPSTNLCDVLNLDSIYQGRRVIRCTGTTYACEATEEDPVEANIAPSECAMRMLLDDAVLTPVALTATDISAQIIFDTGASLAISSFRSDFVAAWERDYKLRELVQSHGPLQQRRSQKYNCVSERITFPPQKRVY
jgi:hypothetical protein